MSTKQLLEKQKLIKKNQLINEFIQLTSEDSRLSWLQKILLDNKNKFDSISCLLDINYVLDVENIILTEEDSKQIKNRETLYVYSNSTQEKLRKIDGLKTFKVEKGLDAASLFMSGLVKSEFQTKSANFLKTKAKITQILASNEYHEYLKHNLEKITENKDEELVGFAKTDNRTNQEVIVDFIIDFKNNSNTGEINKNWYFSRKTPNINVANNLKSLLNLDGGGVVSSVGDYYALITCSDLFKAKDTKNTFIKLIQNSGNSKESVSKYIESNPNVLELIRGVQKINNFEKKVNGELSGNIIPISLNKANNFETIYLTEGVATGFSVKELVGEDKNIISCISSLNMEKVAKEYLEKGYKVIVCGDIDKPLISKNKDETIITPGAGFKVVQNLITFIEQSNEAGIELGCISFQFPKTEQSKDFYLYADGIITNNLNQVSALKNFLPNALSDYNDLINYSNTYLEIKSSIQKIKENLTSPKLLNQNEMQTAQLCLNEYISWQKNHFSITSNGIILQVGLSQKTQSTSNSVPIINQETIKDLSTWLKQSKSFGATKTLLKISAIKIKEKYNLSNEEFIELADKLDKISNLTINTNDVQLLIKNFNTDRTQTLNKDNNQFTI